MPWFPLDALKMALHRGAPALGIAPGGDDRATADAMWPFVETLLDHLVFEGRDYLVEGFDLRPATLAAFIADTDAPVRVVFLGYPEIDLAAKLAAVTAFAGPPTDWLVRTGADHVAQYLAASRDLSIRLRDECAAAGLAFVDTGHDFAAGLSAAEEALMRR